MGEAFDPYHKWLGIGPEEQPPNHYRLLGLRLYESDADVIESAADRQMSHVQTHKTGRHSALSQKLLNELSAAKLCLLNPQKKAAYDQSLRDTLAPATATRQPTPAKPMPLTLVPAPVPSAAAGGPVSTPPQSQPATESPAILRTRRKKSASRQLLPLLSLTLTAGLIAWLIYYVLEHTTVATPVQSIASQEGAHAGGSLQDSGVGPQAGDERVAAESEEQNAPSHVIQPATPNGVPSDALNSKPTPPATLAELLRPAGAGSGRPLEPEPDADAIAAAEETIEQTYKTELTSAKSPLEKKAVAQRFLDTALSTSESAAVFALLQASAELSAEAGHYDLASEAIDSLGERFRIDVLAQKEAALESAARMAKTGDQRLVADSWKALADEAVMLDRYQEASRFLDEAIASARKTGDKTLVALLVQANDDVESLRASFDAARPARDALQKNLNDPMAAAAWGRFLSAYKNDWDRGLQVWALGNDPLADLAREDLATSADPREQVRLADAWWEAAEKESEPLPRKWLQARAAHWYRRALPALSGLEQDRAKKRVAESEQAVAPFPQGQWVDVLDMVDLSRHAVVGEWVRRGDEIATTKRVPRSRVMIPVVLDGSYDLELRYTSGSGSITGLVLPVGQGACKLIVGGYNGSTSGLELVDGKAANQNASTAMHGKIPLGQKHRLELHVQVFGDRAIVEVDLDTRKLIRWKGPTTSLSLGSDWTLPHAAPGIVAYDQVTLFHSARLRVHSGTARLVHD